MTYCHYSILVLSARLYIEIHIISAVKIIFYKKVICIVSLPKYLITIRVWIVAPP